MKKVAVAVAHINPARRANLQQLLQGEQDIKVRTNVMSLSKGRGMRRALAQTRCGHDRN
jgi:hypothetical protein